MQLALHATKQNALIPRRRAAIYRVPQSTVSDRRAGQTLLAHLIAKSRKLEDKAERAILEHMMELTV
jgi:hypothetical protein